MPNHRNQLSGLVVCLFFLSGLSGLIYEIIWVRMLTMFVGGSAFSVSIILTVFMAGLALGSAIAAQLVDRIQRSESLVLIYGFLELVIGGYGLLFPTIIICFKPLYALIYRQLSQSLLAYNSVSSLISIILLIIPTTLMGATLPILCRYYVQMLPHMGTRTGRLYGLNTIGAAIGTLLCGFWMIRWLGIQGSLFTAVGINALIGLVCIAIFAPRKEWRRGFRIFEQDFHRIRNPQSVIHNPCVLAILVVSGFCSMSYEVIWTKLLALLVGPTTYSFTIVLFTFITGLGLGSMIFGWLCDKMRNPFTLLVITQFTAAALTLSISHVMGNSQLFFAKLLYQFRDSFLLGESMKTACVILFMLPATLCLGAVFPIANKICTKSLSSVGSSVGVLYAFNTIGAFLGSFCAGFLLIPLCGKALSISLLTALQVFTSCLVYLGITSKHRGGWFPVVLCSTIIILACCFLPRWNQGSLTRGKYHRFSHFHDTLENTSFLKALFEGREVFSREPIQDEILFFDDGIGGFVAVSREIDSLGVTNLFLSISGKVDASSRVDLSTMTLSGQVPMLFHSNAVNVMVVGLASGITAGEILHYPVKQLDILEISPEVVRACEFFTPWNNNVLSDPRARVIIQDARTHLTLTDQMYDVIMSEPSNPWMAGVANLFTVEYYQKVRQHLNPGGIFVQWFHTYQTDWETFSMVGRTVQRIFPNSLLMKTATEGSDYLIVCFKDSKAMLELSIAERNLIYAARSRNMRISSAKVIYPLIVSENLDEVLSEGMIHTDDHPHLEYLAPRQLYKGGVDFSDKILGKRKISLRTGLVLAEFTEIDKQLALADFMASMNIAPFGMVNLSKATKDQVKQYRTIVESFCRGHKVSDYDKIADSEDRALCLVIHEQQILGHLDEEAKGGHSGARLGKAYYDLGNVYLARGDFNSAIPCYQQSLIHLRDYFNALFNLGICYEQTGQHVEAIEIFNVLISTYPHSAKLLSRLASNHLRLDRQDMALELFEKAIAINNSYAPALLAAGAIYGAKEDFTRAIEYSKRAIKANPSAVKAYQNIAIALVRMNKLQEALEYVESGLSVDPQSEVLLSLKELLSPIQE